MSKDEIIAQIIASLNKFGLTNPFIQAAILAIVSKESAFVLGTGENMNYTNPERLMFVWPKLFPTTESAMPYVRQPEKLANYVYGNKYGNTAPGDGWKYRGRGFNGITFKSNYDVFGKMIGVDLVKYPDKLNEVPTAADALAAYFLRGLKNSNGELQNDPEISAADHNDFQELQPAVRAAMRANAGWKSSTNGNIFKEGYARAMQNAPGFYNLVRALGPVVQAAVFPAPMVVRAWKDKKKRPYVIAGGVFLVGGITTALYYALRK